jgi:hypothetical protein
MKDIHNNNGDGVANCAPTDKRSWVTPAVRVEQVSDVTRNGSGIGFDGGTCHS